MATRTVKIWGGEAVLAAAGPKAGVALGVATASLGQMVRDLEADLVLLSGRSFDVLPRSAPARRAVEARRQIAQILDVADKAVLPPALVALPGALADETLQVFTGHQGIEAAAIAAGGTLALSGRGAGRLAGSGVDELVTEFDDALSAPSVRMSGGMAVSGLAGPHPITGLADITACAAGTAAEAAMAAAVLADAVGLGPGMARLAGRSAGDGVGAGGYGPGFHGIAVTKSVEQMAPDLIWEALSAGVRLASALRQAKLISAAVLTLKGRGRTVGPVDHDRLLRFGVSDWG